MSCNGCAKKFSVFKSERGCPGCGFGYCSKCLEHPIYVKKFNKVTKVCNKCKMADEKGSNAGSSEIEPPKAYLRRLESLENPSRPPITVYQTNDRLQRLKKGLSQEDYQIAERLERLREDRKKGPIPSDNEIKERLAKLRDESFEISSKSNIPATDMRTDQEKCDDLLSQYMEEASIEEGRNNIDKDIQQRINVLKGIPANASNIPNIPSENLSDEEMASRLLTQILSKMSDDEESDISSVKSVEDVSEKSSEEAMSEDLTSDDEDNSKKPKKKK